MSAANQDAESFNLDTSPMRPKVAVEWLEDLLDAYVTACIEAVHAKNEAKAQEAYNRGEALTIALKFMEAEFEANP